MAFNDNDLYYAQRGSGQGATRGLVTGATLRSTAGFPVGTKTVFYQASAPVYWTQDSSYNNQQLRIVRSGQTGGSTGGSIAVTSFYTGTQVIGAGGAITAGSVGPTTLTADTMGNHLHNVSPNNVAGGGNATPNTSRFDPVSVSLGSPSINTQGTGGNGSHTHNFNLPTPFTINATLPWNVRYAAAIVCTKTS